jgi:RimJ/RimL family protein N-acetyltransferase
MGWWTIEEPTLGDVGTVGVFRRELGPELEIGWAIDRAHWSRGFASEAARAALDFAAREWRATRVIAHIAKQNGASMRVAEKIGMEREAEVEIYGKVDWRYAFAAR